MPKLFERIFTGLAKTSTSSGFGGFPCKIDQTLFVGLERSGYSDGNGHNRTSIDDLKSRVQRNVSQSHRIRRLLLEAVAGMLKHPAEPVDATTPRIIVVVG